MSATRHAVATTSQPASAISAELRASWAFMASNSSGLTRCIRIRLAWKVNVSPGSAASRARNIAGSSVSIVVLELGTMRPIRCELVPVAYMSGEPALAKPTQRELLGPGGTRGTVVDRPAEVIAIDRDVRLVVGDDGVQKRIEITREHRLVGGVGDDERRQPK